MGRLMGNGIFSSGRPGRDQRLEEGIGVFAMGIEPRVCKSCAAFITRSSDLMFPVSLKIAIRSGKWGCFFHTVPEIWNNG